MWNIYNVNTTDHVGFAIGTIHLPPKAVLTDKAWSSILNALDDSCSVYGEINVNDPQIVAEITQKCTLNGASATVTDIPDEELKDKYLLKIDEISKDVGAGGDELDFIQLLGSVPIGTLLALLSFYNTPEYKDLYFNAVRTGTPVDFLDVDILELGRPAGGLEEVETQCKLLRESHLTPGALVTDFDAVWKPYLELSLEASLSPLIQSYKCGDLKKMEAIIHADLETGHVSDVLVDALLDDRNIQMVAEMTQILNDGIAQNKSKSVFAVGFAHWTIGGENSMESLLLAEGYRLERVEGRYSATELADLSDGTCGFSRAEPQPTSGVLNKHRGISWTGVVATVLIASFVVFF